MSQNHPLHKFFFVLLSSLKQYLFEFRLVVATVFVWFFIMCHVSSVELLVCWCCGKFMEV